MSPSGDSYSDLRNNLPSVDGERAVGGGSAIARRGSFVTFRG